MTGEVVRAPIAVVTDTVSRSGGEPHQLLRVRLRAALIILLVALVAYNQYYEVLHEVEGGDGGLVISTIRSFMFVYFLLMVIYGLLIPNTGFQAARLTLSIAVIPLLVNLFLWFQHPQFWEVCQEYLRFEQISQSTLIMLVGAATVTYGAHVMYRLRRGTDPSRASS